MGLPQSEKLTAATKVRERFAGSGRNTSEAAEAAPEPMIPPQAVPVPTAFTERFQEVEKATAETDLAEKVQAMTLEDNPGLKLPIDLTTSPAEVPAPAPPAGTGVPSGTIGVELSSSDSDTSDSDSFESVPSVEVSDTAAATTALATARATTATIMEGRDVVHLMQEID